MPPVSKALLYNVASQSSANTSLPTRFEINQPNIVKRLWSGITRYRWFSLFRAFLKTF